MYLQINRYSMNKMNNKFNDKSIHTKLPLWLYIALWTKSKHILKPPKQQQHLQQQQQ